jgi:hypothetical protein
VVTNIGYAVRRGEVQRFGLEVAGEVVPRRPEISRLSRSRACPIGMFRSAGLFATGARKPRLAKVWAE